MRIGSAGTSASASARAADGAAVYAAGVPGGAGPRRAPDAGRIAYLIARLASLALLLLLRAIPASAQEVEPRVYLASPIGSNIVLASTAWTGGDVVSDATIPVQDGDIQAGGGIFGYFRSFGLFGRSASLGGTFPLVGANGEGTVVTGPSPIRVHRDLLGPGDSQVRLTVNLFGSPAMDTATFVKRGRRTNLGASLVTGVPTGEFDSAKALNLGTHRWSFKPEVGLSVPVGERWLVEIYAGTWFFTDNPDFVAGTLTQAPMFTSQAHLSYNLSVRAWVSADATFYAGGSTKVDGEVNASRQRNSRLGLTLSLPIATRRQTLKIGASTGAWVRYGADFNTITATWSYGWGRGF